MADEGVGSAADAVEIDLVTAQPVFDAARCGCFVNPTPAVDEEFARLAVEAHLTAIDARVADKIDLLTVIEQELGHIVRLYDLKPSANSLMSGMLSTGTRHTFGKSEIDAFFAEG